MSTRPKVCLVGQVYVDVMYTEASGPPKLRLGGILHAARALWAMDCPYVLAYVAPAYLDKQIVDYAIRHGATRVDKLGDITGSPNVMLIGEPTESVAQGYEDLLHEARDPHLDMEILGRTMAEEHVTDVVVFPGGFDLQATLETLQPTSANVYIDINYAPDDLEELAALGREFASVIVSTSSTTFLETCHGVPWELCDAILGRYSSNLLLKENRGGSRLFLTSSRNDPIRTPAHTRPVQHSVGVGDCFNVVYAACRHRMSDEEALAYASFVAAEYASTTFVDDFRAATQASLKISPEEIVQLDGVSLPWESRPIVNVYIAGPDFDHVDTEAIDRVEEALRYHNFVPRLPVRENGQVSEAADRGQRQEVCEADLRLLRECQMLLAVQLFDDPGTLIEIGIAAERGIPVLVYDPYDRARNLILTQVPSLISDSLDEVVASVFEHAARLVR